MLLVTVNPGGEARASEYETTTDSWKSRGHVGRDRVPVAEQRGVGVGRRLVGRRRAGRRRAGRGRGVGPVAGEGAPRREVGGKVVAFQGSSGRRLSLGTQSAVGALPNR